MTQITPFTAVPNRGMSQETLVDTTNTFFSEVGGFVGQANQLIEDINTAATNAVFTAPDWVAQAYESHKVVIYTDHNVYMSTEATLSTDVPSVSAKWQRMNASLSGSFDMQVFTSSGTWNKPEGASMVRIILAGGGGGGASGCLTGSGATSIGQGGAGGGGGGTLDVTIPSFLLDTTQSVVIGAGGSGGIGAQHAGDSVYGAPGNSGSVGGDTSFHSFIAYGGGSGSWTEPYGDSLCFTGYGGDNSFAEQYILSSGDNLPSPTMKQFGGLSVHKGARFQNNADASNYRAYYFSSVFGGCVTPGQCASSSSQYYLFYQEPYSSLSLCSSIFGGASGAHGGLTYLSAGSSGTKKPINAYTSTKVSPKKFLPSIISTSYTSVGGNGGNASLTGAGGVGTNGTGYGAGGGGGGAGMWGYANAAGGNGSPGIAIIISW